MSSAAILEASSPAQIEPTYHQHAANARPVSIYELHPGSWMRVPEQNFRPLTGAELAPRLAEYVDRLNFTHVQMLFTPDHPNGVQAAELQPLIEKLQERNIGVILDGAESLGFAWPGALASTGGEIPEVLQQLPAAGVRHGNVTLLNENGNAVTLTWDARWSPAMLDYFGFDPIERKFHHAELFAHDEVDGDFLLPLSHNDVSAGRRSLLAECPGMNGRDSPICGCCSPTCGRGRAKSFSLWAASSANGAGGIRRPASTGISSVPAAFISACN
jgi:hypothetical protein